MAVAAYVIIPVSMKPNSISGITCSAKDLNDTKKFYEVLGFRIGKEEPGCLTVYVNWFWIKFTEQGKASGDNGINMVINIKVENLNNAYETVRLNKFKILSEPQEVSKGRKEFIIQDPDGYKLAFFESK